MDRLEIERLLDNIFSAHHHEVCDRFCTSIDHDIENVEALITARAVEELEILQDTFRASFTPRNAGKLRDLKRAALTNPGPELTKMIAMMEIQDGEIERAGKITYLAIQNRIATLQKGQDSG